MSNAARAAVLYAGPLGGMATRFQTLATIANQSGGSMAALAGGIALAVGAFSTMTNAIIETERTLQRGEKSLTAVQGSSALAQLDMKYLAETSDKLGVSVKTMIPDFTKWTAAVKGSSLEGQKGRDVFEGLVAVGSQLGLESTSISLALRALQQMMSKGKVQAEELRGQLGEHLPGAFKRAAEGMGITTQKLDQLLKKGEVLPGVLIPKMIEQMKLMYGIDLSKPIVGLVQSEGKFATAMTTFLDVFDKTFHITDSYIKLLDGLTSGLSTVGKNLANIAPYLGLVGGLFAGLAAPAIIAGIGALASGIVSLTMAVIGLNAAALTGGGFALLVVKLAAAAGGAYLGFKLMEGAVSGTTTALQGGIPAVDKYIEGMKNAKIHIKTTTDMYMEQAVARQKLADIEVRAAVDAEDAAKGTGGLDAATRRRKAAVATSEAIDIQVAALKRIQGLPTENPLEKLAPDEKGAKKSANAIREVTQEITKYENQLAGIRGGPEIQRLNKEQAEVTEELEKWKDKLDDAGVSSERTAKLIDRLKTAFVGVKTATREMERTTTPLQFVQTAFEKLSSTGVDKFVDGLMEGTLTLKTFAEIGKSVIADLMKDFIRLAAMAPLKNLLFGTTDKTFGLLSSGSPGVGGLLGGLFGAGSSSAAGGLGGVNTGLASAVAATTKGFGSALGNVFANGISGYSNSIVSKPTMFRFARGAGVMGEAGPEAVMPLTRLSGGRLGVSADGGGGGGPQTVVQIINQNGSRVEQRTQRKGGRDIIKVMIKDVMMDDLASNGEYARANQRLYGQSRMGGRR
jgi:tape measure domain-containing protein